MPLDLLFVTTTMDGNAFKDIALKHGIRVKKKEITCNVITWLVETDEDLAQVCNFMNEAGYQGIRVTASMIR